MADKCHWAALAVLDKLAAKGTTAALQQPGLCLVLGREKENLMDYLKLERRWAWVYLVNLIFYLMPLFYVDYQPWQLGLILAVLLLFVLSYYWAYASSPASMWQPVLLMLLLATAITPLNHGSVVIFAFSGFFIGFAWRPSRALPAVAGILLLMTTLRFVLNIQAPYFLSYGSVLLLLVVVFGYLERKRQQNSHLQQQSQSEISQLAKMVERERIARDLHDIMGHSLSGIILKADLANALLAANQPENARLQLTELSQVAREALSQVRQTVSGYKHKGLLAEVGALAQQLREQGIAVTLTGDIPQLPARHESALILMLTELCTNILRHSKADNCVIAFTVDASHWQVLVKDNGKATTLNFGNGLTGISERLAALQGELSYQLTDGCLVCLRLPKTDNAQAPADTRIKQQ